MPRPDPHDLLDLSQEREHQDRVIQRALEMAAILDRTPLRPDTMFMSREDWADIVKWTQENPPSGVVAVPPEPEPVRRSRFARILEDESA